jgi:hypothetical protein
MSLSAFIDDSHQEIIREFAAFAKTLMPPGTTMSDADLRDQRGRHTDGDWRRHGDRTDR